MSNTYCGTDPICNAFATHSELWFIGLGLAGIYVVSFFLSWIGSYIWAWIDEAKVKRRAFIKFIGGFNGWKESNGHCWAFYRGKDYSGRTSESDGFQIFMIPLLALLLSPLTIIFYEVALFITSGIALAHMARFARRHKKMFDSHVTDKDAHK